MIIDKKKLFLLFLFRVFNACLCVSYCYPDELSQSAEVGYNTVFGNGWITGEWREKEGGDIYGIRASYHSFIYAIVYFVLKTFHLDGFHWIFINAPKVLNGSLAFLMDYSIYRYALLRTGRNKKIATTTLIFSVFCFPNCHFGIRFFSNSLEAILTSVGLWLWAEFEEKLRELETGNSKETSVIIWPLIGLVWIVGFAIFLRYANLVIWFPHAILFFVHDGVNWRINLKYLQRKICLLFSLGWKNYVLALISLGFVVVVQFLCDWYVYGQPIVPIYRNFNFNVIEGKSQRWESESPWWYITIVFPMFLLGYIIPFAFGVLKDRQCLRECSVFVLLLVVLSLIHHKEMRFLYPGCPFLVCIAARGMHVEWSLGKWGETKTDKSEKGVAEGNKKKKNFRWKIFKYFYFCLCIGINLCVAWLLNRTLLERPLYDSLADVRQYVLHNETGLFLNLKIFYFPLQTYFHLSHLFELWHFAGLEGYLSTRECWNHEQCRPFDENSWTDNLLVYKRDMNLVRERLKKYNLESAYLVVKEYHSQLDNGTDVLLLKKKEKSLRN